ncbi:hypothetical protein AU195_12775 [Mycobacterium sp. IS-1496]|uniref:hypothetical protein n=1 Tax=Mycobacterium sp. IS-1496 TaxID=1772284 RepID=UPI0007415114|nr:hypothetical protein [Mycobacterium sp. IS-1496]KUI36588.1 hypothetical protein AU195_12775 [Mycobacterium sp. IS-1496]
MADSSEQKSAAERASDLTERAGKLSDEVLKSVESGQRSAIEAVRKFVSAVEESLPSRGEDHPSKRDTIIDAAFDMADKLVTTQYEFIRSVVGSASQTLRKDEGDKPGAE